MDSMIREYRVGKLRVFHFTTAWFKLDGGAMFGVVPKVLWSRGIESDGKNRIPMATNLLLVETDEGLLLVDTGIGDKWDEKKREIYSIELKNPWKEMGISPQDVKHVVLTHLHFDHAGGATYLFEGKLKPYFGSAKYYVQRAEWEDANNPNERTKASYRREDFEPLSDWIVLLEGEVEIVKGVKVIPTGGHTRGHQIVLVESGGEKACYLGDLVPMVNHLPLPYIMAYDNYPLDTLAQKKRVYEIAHREGWLLLFEHDRFPSAGWLKLEDGKWQIEKF